MHYYQFNIGDYKSHTSHLSYIEDIIYRRLLDWYYLHEKPIPKDINIVARMIAMNDCLTSVEQVLKEFFTYTKNGWINQRADKEINSYHNKISSNSRAGKISAEKRKTYSEQMLNKRSSNVQPNINHKPLTNNHNKYIPPIPAELLSEWMIHRKKKPVTERVFKNLEVEAAKIGWSVIQAVEYACANSWQGFKADWVTKDIYHKKNDRAGAVQAIFGKNFGQEEIIEKDITHDAITF